jgi:ribonuclease P protein component
VLYRANNIGTARLGLAISKKCARRSVDRNRLKRIARESFRLSQLDLPGVDVIILCSRGAVELPNHLLFQALDSAWLSIRKSVCDQS